MALSGLLLAVGVGAVLSDSDAIAKRRALMKANGDATKIVVGMLEGAPFDLAAVRAAIVDEAIADHLESLPAGG